MPIVLFIAASAAMIQPQPSTTEAVWHTMIGIGKNRKFEITSKRRKGFPSETQVKRGVRIVHGNKELIEKLGRNERLGTSRNHFRLLIPENFFHGVCLIEMSMRNIISFLRGMHGVDPKTLKFSWPADADGFDKPWAGSVGVTDCQFDLMVEASQIKHSPTKKSERHTRNH